MSLLVGEQSDYYEYKPNSSDTSHYYSQFYDSKEENKLDVIHGTTEPYAFKRTISLHPVYVNMVDGIEQLVYNSRLMDIGKKYRVTWNNEEFIIIKNEHNVDFYKFFPEN